MFTHFHIYAGARDMGSSSKGVGAFEMRLTSFDLIPATLLETEVCVIGKSRTLREIIPTMHTSKLGFIKCKKTCGISSIF